MLQNYEEAMMMIAQYVSRYAHVDDTMTSSSDPRRDLIFIARAMKAMQKRINDLEINQNSLEKRIINLQRFGERSGSAKHPK